MNKELDGFQSEIDQKLDILQESISKLTNQFVHQEEENLEEECLTETILVEQAQLQPQEELEVELVEASPEELPDALESGDTFWPWKKQEHISALISEEGSGKEIVEDPQKHVLQPIPTNPTANAKTTYSPLPVRGGKIGPTRWASPVCPKLGLGWAIKFWPEKTGPNLARPGMARPA